MRTKETICSPVDEKESRSRMNVLGDEKGELFNPKEENLPYSAPL